MSRAKDIAFLFYGAGSRLDPTVQCPFTCTGNALVAYAPGAQFREIFRKKEDDCNELSNNIYEQRRDFKRMFGKAKDWKSLVDLSKKALGTTGLEIIFELKNNKEELEKEDAVSQQMQRKNEMNKKPMVMN